MQIALVCMAGISVYLILYGFVGPSLIQKSIYRRRFNDIKDRSVLDLYKKNQSDSSLLKNLLERCQPFVERVSGKDTDKAEKKFKEVSQLLYSAGISVSPSTYLFTEKIVTILSFAVGAFLLLAIDDKMVGLLVFAIILLLPFIFFRYSLKLKVTMRKSLIGRQLPDILDLLSISVDAGMGFDQALDYVVNNMDGPLIDELTILMREMSLGRARKDAFKNLSTRLGIESVSNFTSAVIQASEMGISMRDVLKTQADVARTTRVNEVKAKAAKASIKMLIPMVCFIFPVLFIVLMGPAVINMIEGGFLG